MKLSHEQSALLVAALLHAHGTGNDSAGAKIAADPDGAIAAADAADKGDPIEDDEEPEADDGSDTIESQLEDAPHPDQV